LQGVRFWREVRFAISLWREAKQIGAGKHEVIVGLASPSLI
jgi:hypothetical protein